MEQATTEDVQVTQAQESQPAPGAEGTQSQEAQTTDQTPASEVAQEKGEEQHKSRQWRRLDRWRTRAIEAEARLKAYQEFGARETRQEVKQEDNEPKREQFNSYEEFIEARAAYKAEKVAEEKARKIIDESRKKSEQERTQSEQAEVNAKFDAHYQKAADEIEDFEDVMSDQESVASLGRVFGPSKHLMTQAIIEAGDKGPLILYHLAKNPAEVERIAKLSPAKQVAAIVALEEKVAKPAKQPSKAPEPIRPVGTRGEAAKDPSKMTQEEFNEWRRQGGK